MDPVLVGILVLSFIVESGFNRLAEQNEKKNSPPAAVAPAPAMPELAVKPVEEAQPPEKSGPP